MPLRSTPTGRPTDRGCGDFAWRASGWSGSQRHRRLLFRNAKVSWSAAGTCAHYIFGACAQTNSLTRVKSAELVSRCDDGREVLGRRSYLSSHRADLDELFFARGAANNLPRRFGRTMEP